MTAGAVNREIVLENDAVIGSVDANLRHYRQAADILADADSTWLADMVTRRVSLDKAAYALEIGEDDVKVVIDMDGKR